MKTNSKACVGLLFSAIAAVAWPLAAGAQESGGGEGGGGGCGDVFGDLIHILRHDVTGQPILAQRWVELPGVEQGYGWGYCPIAVYHDEEGAQQEIPFAPLSCDLNPDDLELVEEVNYFGRLNGGRTKERNHRMHFDEVVSNIKQATTVTTDETGRLKMEFCDSNDVCDWATIDSPMESMALYVRLMKYGHIQTDPMEVDVWAKGDPSLPEQYHPALEASDYDKFDNELKFLLPGGKSNPKVCFDSLGVFDPLCADREALEEEDLLGSAVYLAAAANKTGMITRDLVQYVNRILKITKDTDHTLATLNTLPALYRDCWTRADDPYGPEDEPTEEPPYDYDACVLVDPDEVESVPNWSLYTDIRERFVNFGVLQNYGRKQAKAEVVVEGNDLNSWTLEKNVSIADFVQAVNGPVQKTGDIDGFVSASDDTVRAIEFIHNYAPPENLWCAYATEECDAL